MLAQAGQITHTFAAAAGGEQTVRRRLRFTLTFRNTSARMLSASSFWAYLPADRPPYQVLRAIQVSEPYQVEHDSLGHRILSLSFSRIAAQAHKVVTLTTEVEMQPGQPDPVMETSPQPVVWLNPQHNIESDDVRILKQAELLRRSTPRETARAIYDWVIQRMTYAGYLAEELGAVQALVQGRGDCTEYADLVAALARAAGIPARVVGGYVVDRDTTPRPQDYHNWSELYLDGGWRLVDAQKRYWLDSPGYQYIVFRIHHDEMINRVGLAQRYRITEGLGVTF